MNGYNILINSQSSEKYSGSGSISNYGFTIGTNNSKVVKLVGFSRQGTIDKDRMVGNKAENATPYGSGGYVVFADFDGNLTKYFFYRYCVWYLLFSGRQATKAQFKSEYKRYAEWLKENGCYRTISPLSRMIKGESLKDRICVLVMRIVGRLHLVGLFASVYCKG